MKHQLELDSLTFQGVLHRLRTFELIKNQDFKPGDQLIIREKDPVGSSPTGRNVVFNITYVLKNHPGLKKDFVLLSLVPLEPDPGTLFDAYFAGARYAWAENSSTDEMREKFFTWLDSYTYIKASV